MVCMTWKHNDHTASARVRELADTQADARPAALRRSEVTT